MKTEIEAGIDEKIAQFLFEIVTKSLSFKKSARRHFNCRRSVSDVAGGLHE